MTKPRWIDAGAFRNLRAATRSRRLAVIVGPKHGSAAINSRAELKAALGEGDRASLAGDARFHSKPDAGLTALYTLRMPCLVTTSVSDAVLASAPAGHSPPRVFGPDSKGLNSAWDRKELAVVRLCGAVDEPASLVLTTRDRKVLLAHDSRYQNFLRATFSRTVLFTGFDLADGDLIELLEDVSRGFSGHVPPNVALVPAGATDPSTALRASMHYGTSLVEYPPEMSADAVLAELASLLEELEVPKPASGNPPRGFTELTSAQREAVPAADVTTLDLFDRGDSSSWQSIKAAADAPRQVAAQIAEFLVGTVEPGQTRIALVRGRQGEGKSTLLRRVAWDLAVAGRRVFWREFGAGVPDRYVPEEDDKAIAVFVADDADELDNLPSLVNYLAAHGAGKARFLLAAETDAWERSGLDHRIRRTTTILDVMLATPEPAEGKAIAEGLRARGRLAAGASVDAVADSLRLGDRCLMDRIAEARGVKSVAEAVAARLRAIDAKPDAPLLRRAYLATALVHRYGMSLGRVHLASVLGLPEAELDARVLAPLDKSLVAAGPGSVRTRHPVVAAAACSLLAPDDATRDPMVIDLLAALPGGAVADEAVFHSPSELIRALRHGQLAPLMVDKFFSAGENAADGDTHFWFDRGRFDVGFERWESALAHLDRALLRAPGDTFERDHNAAVHGFRARCLLALKKKKEALHAVEEGLRLSPHDSVLERLYEKLGERRGVGPRGAREGRPQGRGRPGTEAGPGGSNGAGRSRAGGEAGPRGGGERRAGPGAGQGGRGETRRPARRGPPRGAGQPGRS